MNTDNVFNKVERYVKLQGHALCGTEITLRQCPVLHKKIKNNDYILADRLVNQGEVNLPELLQPVIGTQYKKLYKTYNLRRSKSLTIIKL